LSSHGGKAIKIFSQCVQTDEKGFADNLKRALFEFKKAYQEFKDALTELIDNAIHHTDINANRKLRNRRLRSTKAMTPPILSLSLCRLTKSDKVKRMAIHCCGKEIVFSTTLVSKLLMIIFEVSDSDLRNKDAISIDENPKNGLRYDLAITDMPQMPYSEKGDQR
jgi:hypothetical protein